MKRISYAGLLPLFVLIMSGTASGQVSQRASTVDPTTAAKQSLALAEYGKCKEALQLLKKTPRSADRDLKLKAGVNDLGVAQSTTIKPKQRLKLFSC